MKDLNKGFLFFHGKNSNSDDDFDAEEESVEPAGLGADDDEYSDTDDIEASFDSLGE